MRTLVLALLCLTLAIAAWFTTGWLLFAIACITLVLALVAWIDNPPRRPWWRPSDEQWRRRWK
jgi:hypothetical protein